MPILADEYKNFPERNIERSRGDAPEIWRIAKPKPQPLIYRIRDAWHVLIGKYDAVYYHETVSTDTNSHRQVTLLN